ncbi:MAG: alpha/beta hydrolase [Lachnospiraceae bacterium]|nr:alpha/beta hydrolase [Lachnospiraceae bacterium]
MLHKTIRIKTDAPGPGAELTTYLLSKSPEIDGAPKPLILMCPGGGYAYTSDREAEPIALCFNSMGYHAAVLRYSCAPAKFPTAVSEAALAFALIRKNAKKWNVDTSRIFIQGCSSGGHLAFSYAVFYAEEELLKLTGLTAAEARPAGVILSYPVITSGKYAHRGSFEVLTGKPYEEAKKDPLFKKLSLETQVKADTPPVFVWHTWPDGCVPVENTLLLLDALAKKKVSAEAHIFPVGEHGLGLCNEVTMTPGEHYGIQPECEQWIRLAGEWLKRQCGKGK